MNTEILVNTGLQETRVALVEGGAVQEVHIQRPGRHGVVGNIYKGAVRRVLPGMQAAFIDVGLERTAFLHISDMLRSPEDPITGQPQLRCPPPAPAGQGTPLIERLLREGQDVLVQVVKDPLGSKGARLTTLLSIPSRYLVLLPFEQHLGISARIEDEPERERLKGILERHAPAHVPYWGLIARTAAEGASEEALVADMDFLVRLWISVMTDVETATTGRMVHGDLPLSMRIFRDLLGTSVDRVRVDTRPEFERLKAFAETFIPDAAAKVELYEGQAPLFDLYGAEDDIARALEREVDLKSGGRLVFDQTEAMTTVDVNTGAFTGSKSLEETIFKTNLEAAQAIARQLRLRNLGGIIIVDFIDMAQEEHRAQVIRTFQAALVRDSACTQVYPLSPLGLVEMTRKRTRESLGHILCEPCPTCTGRGQLKTAETVCNEIAREVQRAARQFDAKSFLVLAAPRVIEKLLEQAGGLAELEVQFKRPIRLQPEAAYPPESFDVVPL